MEAPEIFGESGQKGFNFPVDAIHTPSLVEWLRKEVTGFEVHINCGDNTTTPQMPFDMFVVRFMDKGVLSGLLQEFYSRLN
jgi:hypothetical protein